MVRLRLDEGHRLWAEEGTAMPMVLWRKKGDEVGSGGGGWSCCCDVCAEWKEGRSTKGLS